jgi:hypothetical protein
MMTTDADVAGRAQRGTGSSTTDRKICSTDRGSSAARYGVGLLAAIYQSCLSRRRAIGAIDDDDVGGRRRGATYGVIDNRSENLQH